MEGARLARRDDLARLAHSLGLEMLRSAPALLRVLRGRARTAKAGPGTIEAPASLESSKEANVAHYERHGFRVTAELELPGGDPVCGRCGARAALPPSDPSRRY